jgi:hypothetical protein
MRATLPNPAKENAQSGHVDRIKGLDRAARNVKFNVLQRAFAAADKTDADTNDKLVIVRMRINLRLYNAADAAGKEAMIEQRRDELLSELGLNSSGEERVVFQVDLNGWAKAYLASVASEYDIDL